jgi:hypothetical protein
MFTLRLSRLSAAIALVTLATFTACSMDPVAPPLAGSPRPTESPVQATATTTSTSGTLVNGLLWTKAVSQTSVSRVIGPSGGSLSISNGIKITVPRGAVSTNTTFTVTRLPGTIVAYDFQPHGTAFAVPLTIEQPTLGTNVMKAPTVSSIEGAYFPLSSSLDQTNGSAVVTEFEPTFVSADRAWITFTVKHFSGYIVAMGRK